MKHTNDARGKAFGLAWREDSKYRLSIEMLLAEKDYGCERIYDLMI